jgi:hypothetical protein
MPLSGIRTHDPSNQPAKTHASDRTATVTGSYNLRMINIITFITLPPKNIRMIKSRRKYVCSTDGGDEKYVQNFGWKAGTKTITRKTWAKMRR